MYQDITSKKFGRLTVIKQNGFYRKMARWDCICDCGNYCNVIGSNLKRGNSRSCGCLGLEARKARATHGMYGTQFYLTYYRIKARCGNSNYPEYHFYGGRGIKCEWDSFEQFKEDMYESYLSHSQKYKGRQTSIERIDVNGNYCKQNCKWATVAEQSRNRRSNVMLTFNGKTQCLTDWAKEYGLVRACLNKRIISGWDLEKAFTTPPR